ncbi:MAG: DNA mismatch repair protein MutS [Desulfonauticus sp. 38_4375]|nr:MAG: DNA mismatch repair protein MutS [Desulfonauticus sp. 38_4375]
MLEQYLGIKENYQDCLLFFRMGDFYELFFEDAEIAAKELQIALTSRSPNAELKVPMCGVPHHAVNEYLKQLLEKGYKVAICDQIEDPKEAKGIVRREVTRVLTPGTIVEDLNLEAKNNNFLSSIYWDENKKEGSLVWADFSTGFWTGMEVKKIEELWQWLIKIDPKEILFPDTLTIPTEIKNIFPDKIRVVNSITFFSLQNSINLILKAQNIPDLSLIDLSGRNSVIRSCGAILQYYLQTQKKSTFHLDTFTLFRSNNYLILDEVTEKNLELFKLLDGKKGPGTLIYVLDNTLTSMGGRLLKEILSKPFKDKQVVLKQQESVKFLFDQDELRQNLRNLLAKVYDLERLSVRIFLGKANPKDLVALRESLKILPYIQDQLSLINPKPKLLENIYTSWDNLKEVQEKLEKAILDNPSPLITEGNIFKTGYDQELDSLIDLTEHAEQKLKDLLEKEQTNYNLPKLKLGYNKVFGYYFELSKAYKGDIPAHFERKQTLVNSERFITPELKELEISILNASEKRKLKEYELFQTLREELSLEKERFKTIAKNVAWLDYWQSLAETARKWEWTQPEISEDMELSIIQGRHPSIEGVIGKNNYIPTDVHLDKSTQVLIITGPNMAGKSTVLRKTALICILAQIGSFVPAKKAKIGLVDRIFSRVGASDNLAQGQSTFMVEMTETARILRQATKRSLIILDEIGRGTSTFDGLALAWAVAEELCKKYGGIRTLFATHYHELTKLEKEYANLKNFNIAVKEWKGEIIFLRKLLPGPADKSYGIEVAKLAGIPLNVVQRAKEILNNLEKKEEEIKRRVTQKTLFATSLPSTPKEPHPIVQELEKIDLNRLTPLEAMNILYKLQKKWVKKNEN